MLKREHGLNQAGDTGGCLRVADVRLNGADRTVVLCIGLCAESLCQSRNFDGVAERCTGSVCLNISDGLRIYFRQRQRLFNHARLPLDARRSEANFQRAVVIDSGPFDDCVNCVAIAERVSKSLQDDDADAVSFDSSLRTSVESAAMAVRGDYAALLMKRALAVRHADRHASRQSHVALAIQQTLASQMHSDERS